MSGIDLKELYAFWRNRIAGISDSGLNAPRVGIQELIRHPDVTQERMESIQFDELCKLLEYEPKRRKQLLSQVSRIYGIEGKRSHI